MKVDHELKVWPPHYDAVECDEKTFEIRKADRDFQVGDVCLLKEYMPATHGFPGSFSGKSCHRRICYVLVGGEFGMLPGFVVIGIKPIHGFQEPSTPVPTERRDTRAVA